MKNNKTPKKPVHLILTVFLAMALTISLNIILMPYYQSPDYGIPQDQYLPLLGILSPLLEELLFRFFLYGQALSLIKRLWGKESLRLKISLALISSLVFALYHSNPLQSVYAFIMGLFMCLVYETGMGFLSSALFHISANITALTILTLPVFNQKATAALICCCGFILAILITPYLCKGILTGIRE